MKILDSRISIFDWATARLRHRKAPDAFTLIELLVVIAIIAILAALVLNTAGYIQKKAARSRAETEIAALSAALESYKADNGDYPGATNAVGLTRTENANILYKALVLSDPTYNPSGKVYFEPSKSHLQSKTASFNSSSNYFVDPFGTPYQYRYPGDANKSGTNFFDLWSYAGASGSKATENATNHVFWIVNW